MVYHQSHVRVVVKKRGVTSAFDVHKSIAASILESFIGGEDPGVFKGSRPEYGAIHVSIKEAESVTVERIKIPTSFVLIE